MPDLYANGADKPPRLYSISNVSNGQTFTLYPYQQGSGPAVRDNARIQINSRDNTETTITIESDQGYELRDPRTKTRVTSLNWTLHGGTIDLVFVLDATNGHYWELVYAGSAAPIGLHYTPIKTVLDDGYQVAVNEIVLCDASGGNFSVNAPASPAPNDRFSVKMASDTGVVGINATAIESPFGSIGGSTSTVVFGFGAIAVWRYDVVAGMWLVDSVAKLATYVELWQATPIVGMLADTIQWTFVPVFSGQSPILTTYLAGVFTFTDVMNLGIQIRGVVTFQLAANNSDAEYSIVNSFSGSGINVIVDQIDNFAHARIGSFPRSFGTGGSLVAAPADTLSFVGDSSGTSASDVDLTSAILAFRLG